MHSLQYSSLTAELSKHPSVFPYFPPLMQMGHQMHSLQHSSLTAELSKHPSVFHDSPPLMQMGHQMHSLRYSCLAAELGKYSSVFHNISQFHPSYADWPPNAFSAIFESHCRIKQTSLSILQYFTTSSLLYRLATKCILCNTRVLLQN